MLDNMESSQNGSRVEAPETRPSQPIVSSNDSNDGVTPNLNWRVPPDTRRKKGLFNQRHSIHFAQSNYRTFSIFAPQKETVTHLDKFNIPICCIQEHRFIHTKLMTLKSSHDLSVDTPYLLPLHGKQPLQELVLLSGQDSYQSYLLFPKFLTVLLLLTSKRTQNLNSSDARRKN